MTRVDIPILGSDGTVGGPGGSPLSPTATGIPESVGSASQDLLVFNGSTFARLAIGSDGQQLSVRSDGTVQYIQAPVFNVMAWSAAVDGVTDDTTAVQNTVNAAVANGGVVQFPAGTCIVSNITGLNNVTVRGAGRYLTTIQQKAASTGYVLAGVNDCTNVTIEHIAINGTNATWSHGINFPFHTTGPSHLVVRYTNIHDLVASSGSGGNAITLGFGASDVTIENNRATNLPGYYILTGLGSSAFSYTDIQIHHNIISNVQTAYTTTSGQPVGAITIGSAWNGVDITDNHISTVGSTGWAAGITCLAPSGASTSTGLTITGNRIKATNDAGIYVHGAAAAGVINGVTVTDNKVDAATLVNNSSACIYVANAASGGEAYLLNPTVSNNIVTSLSGTALGYGIEVVATNGTVNGNTVIGSANPGIVIELTGGSVDGNYVITNGGGFGIEVVNSINVSVAGNTCKACGYGGIAIGNVDAPFASSYITVVGNNCTGNGTNSGGPAYKYAGIVLRDATYCTIEGNTSTGNTNTSGNDSYGIYESTASTGSNNNKILNNDLTGNQGGGIVYVGASDVIRGNTGYNPVGVVTVAVPATTGTVGAAQYDRTFYITNGTSALTLAIPGGPSPVIPASAFGTIHLPALATMKYTYAGGTPTQVVEGE